MIGPKINPSPQLVSFIPCTDNEGWIHNNYGLNKMSQQKNFKLKAHFYNNNNIFYC